MLPLALMFSSFSLAPTPSVQECIVKVDPGGTAFLPMMGPAAEFQEISQWYNSEPLSIAKLKGKVVLVEFWTYSCINCLRQIPYLSHWHKTYKENGLVVIGVHSPEYQFEQDPINVKDAIERLAISYPVAVDSSFATWRAYKNRFWPTSYLIDKNGIIRKKHIGEGGYASMEGAIRELLGEKPLENPQPQSMRFEVLSPEIHLGFARAENYTTEIKIKPNEIATYDYSGRLEPNIVGLTGSWQVNRECITAAGKESKIELNFIASRVYVVLSGLSDDPIKVLLDGAPLPKQYYTKDTDSSGGINVEADRLYEVVDLHGDISRHSLTLIVPAGINLYEFSFGAKSG